MGFYWRSTGFRPAHEALGGTRESSRCLWDFLLRMKGLWCARRTLLLLRRARVGTFVCLEGKLLSSLSCLVDMRDIFCLLGGVLVALLLAQVVLLAQLVE